jgi:hypothetical protein
MVVYESRPDSDDLIGAYRGAHAAAADCDTAKYVTRGYGTRERDYYVGIVVRGVELMCSKIHHIMACYAQPVEQLLFQKESAVIGGYSNSHVRYSPLSLVSDPQPTVPERAISKMSTNPANRRAVSSSGAWRGVAAPNSSSTNMPALSLSIPSTTAALKPS